MSALDEKTFRELCLAQALGALGPKEEAILLGALEHADEKRLAFFAEAVAQVRRPGPEAPLPAPDPSVKRRLFSQLGIDSPSAPGASSAGPRARANESRPASQQPPAHPFAGDASFRAERMGTGRRPEVEPPRPGFGMPARNRVRALAFAGWAMGAGLLIASLSLWHRAEKAETALRASGSQMQALQDSLRIKEAMLAVLSSPQVHYASLKASDTVGAPAAASSGRIYWDGSGHEGILHVTGLPPAPEGRAYFLWILVDDKHDPCVNAGTFSIHKLASGTGGFFRFKGDEDVSKLKILGFEITSEPMDQHAKDGHLHPVGQTLLKSETYL